jgi:hypothetical protein
LIHELNNRWLSSAAYQAPTVLLLHGRQTMGWRNIEIDQLMAEEALMRLATNEDLAGSRTPLTQRSKPAEHARKRLFAAARRVVARIRHT